MLTVRVIDDPADWDGLADPWNALVSNSATDSVFLSFEWLQTWWRRLARSEDRLLLVAVSRDGELCAAAPLLRCRERLAGVPVRSLRALANVHTPKYDWLWAPGDDDAFAAIVESLCRAGGWDVLRLDYVPGDSPTLEAISQIASGMKLRTHREWCISSPYILLVETWDQFEATLSAQFRTKMRKAERQLREMGQLRLVCFENAANRSALLQKAYEIERAAWKGAAGSAIADHPREERFYTEFAALADARGWFRLYFLELDGRPIAFDYCLSRGKTLSALKTGYDPALAKQSPGTVMRRLILERLFEEGTHTKYDMLGAASDWKLRWTSHVQELQSLYVFNRGVRAAAAYELRFGVRRRLERHPRLAAVARRIRASLRRESATGETP